MIDQQELTYWAEKAASSEVENDRLRQVVYGHKSNLIQANYTLRMTVLILATGLAMAAVGLVVALCK